jgi:hypothetical protein
MAKEVRECKDCGADFELTDREKEFFDKNELEYPKRCKDCREARKKKEKK